VRINNLSYHFSLEPMLFQFVGPDQTLGHRMIVFILSSGIDLVLEGNRGNALVGLIQNTFVFMSFSAVMHVFHCHHHSPSPFPTLFVFHLRQTSPAFSISVEPSVRDQPSIFLFPSERDGKYCRIVVQT
jgi:hypothetical protein